MFFKTQEDKMKIIDYGTSRIVIFFGPVVVKIPIIHLFLALKNFFNLLKENDFKKWKNLLSLETKKYSYENSGYLTFTRMLFMGIIHNWLEFTFSLKNRKSKIIATTYFSLFGIINIQRRVKIFEGERYKILKALDLATNNDSCKNPHVFRNEKNFGTLNDGILKIVDYGSPRIQKILLEHGEKISFINCNKDSIDFNRPCLLE